MISKKKIVCVIPARLQSSRFPKKVLVNLLDKPLLEWVWNAAQATKRFDEVYFAVDSQETASLVASFGASYFMTSTSCPSGTERMVEIMQSGAIDADIWVNWQGDEPFINAAMISDLLQSSDTDSSDIGIWTLKKLIENPEHITAPNIAKVVCDHQGNALYFSRSMIPFFRDEKDIPGLISKKVFYKHVGIYAFSKEALQKIAQANQSVLEDAEKLEQLKFLQSGLKIKVHETAYEVMGIDTPEDLRRAEAFAARSLCENSVHI